VRYAHLLSGEVTTDGSEIAEAAVPAPRELSDTRIAALEQTVAELQSEVGDIRQQLAAFRKQFE